MTHQVSPIFLSKFNSPGFTVNDLDVHCLMETHVRSSDTDGLLCSVTPPRHRLCGIGGGVGFFVKDPLKAKKIAHV